MCLLARTLPCTADVEVDLASECSHSLNVIMTLPCAGSVEYKLRLVDPQPARFQQLVGAAAGRGWTAAPGAPGHGAGRLRQAPLGIEPGTTKGPALPRGGAPVLCHPCCLPATTPRPSCPTALPLKVTQLNWRLAEGGGEALYCLGVEDNGHPRGLERGELEASLGVLRSMAAEVGAAAEVLQVGVGCGRAVRRAGEARAEAPAGRATRTGAGMPRACARAHTASPAWVA